MLLHFFSFYALFFFFFGKFSIAALSSFIHTGPVLNVIETEKAIDFDSSGFRLLCRLGLYMLEFEFQAGVVFSRSRGVLEPATTIYFRIRGQVSEARGHAPA
jgi:hypothetical protein